MFIEDHSSIGILRFVHSIQGNEPPVKYSKILFSHSRFNWKKQPKPHQPLQENSFLLIKHNQEKNYYIYIYIHSKCTYVWFRPSVPSISVWFKSKLSKNISDFARPAPLQRQVPDGPSGGVDAAMNHDATKHLISGISGISGLWSSIPILV